MKGKSRGLIRIAATLLGVDESGISLQDDFDLANLSVNESEFNFFFATFNCNTPLSVKEINRFTPESFIPLRLIYTYTNHQSTSWDHFLDTFEISKNTFYHLDFNDVFQSLEAIYNKGRTVYLIDECLKPLNFSNLPPDTYNTIMKSLYSRQSQNIKCVFSCFTTNTLTFDKTDGSNRPVCTFPLKPIADSEIYNFLYPIYYNFRNNYNKDLLEIELTKLVSILGGLPRAVEFFIAVLKTVPRYSTILHIFKAVVDKLSKIYANAVIFEDVLLMSLCGYSEKNLDIELYPDVSIRSAKLIGIFDGYNDSEIASNPHDTICELYLPIIRIVAHSSSYPFISRFVTSIFGDSRNLFEELCLCRILLELTLFSRVSSGLCQSSSVPLPTNILQLFRGVIPIIGNLDTIQYYNFKFPVLYKTFDILPGPNCFDGTFISLCFPLNPREAGLDMIVVIPTSSKKFKCIGIQNKVRSSSVLGGSDILKAIINSYLNMTEHGWECEDISLIFICDSLFPQYILDGFKDLDPEDIDNLNEVSTKKEKFNILQTNNFNVGVICKTNFPIWAGKTSYQIIKRYLDFDKSNPTIPDLKGYVHESKSYNQVQMIKNKLYPPKN